MANSYLPDDILIEIFSRLPAKSVGRCKCLSKLWQATLSTSYFVNLHLSRQTSLSTSQFVNSYLSPTKLHQKESLLLINHDFSLDTIASPVKDNAVSRKLFGGRPRTWEKVWGSCNGLVLLLNCEFEGLVVVNPVLQQQVRVPDPPIPSDLNNGGNIIRLMLHGFGYDVSTDDYKILSVAYCFDRGTFEQVGTIIHVYSLKKGVWRRVLCDFPYEVVGRSRYIVPGSHENGLNHWLVINKELGKHVLLTFDFADEVFSSEISIPSNVDYYNRKYVTASVLRECLIMVTAVHLDNIDAIWMMKDYQTRICWTDICPHYSSPYNNERPGPIKPLCFIGDEEVMMVTGNSLLLFNMETRNVKTMVVNGAPSSSFSDGCVFVESLVSPTSLLLVAQEKEDGNKTQNQTYC